MSSGGLVPPNIPESPCPQVFQYNSHIVPGDISVTVTGLIILIPPSVGSLIYLFVHLQLKAILPSKYVGLIELVDRMNISHNDKLVYRVRFPLSKPLPTVRLISINSQPVCLGPYVSGPIVTDIRLEHSLHRVKSNHTSTQHSLDQNKPYHIDPGGECGRSVAVNPLMVGGRLLKRGEWPWLVAIFILNSLGLEFHCSGSLISPLFVITVGHCMLDTEFKTLRPSDVVTFLGKFNLQQWEEPHSVIKEVSAIYLHPDFDPSNYNSDLALIKLKTSAEFSLFIQPVCLWAQSPTSSHIDLIVGRQATVVGWGKDNLSNKLSPTPRIMEIPIVSTKECVESHSEFFYLTSDTTICAGAKKW